MKTHSMDVVMKRMKKVIEELVFTLLKGYLVFMHAQSLSIVSSQLFSIINYNYYNNIKSLSIS